MRIKQIKAKEILDSRKKPTVEAKIKTTSGVFKASIPSGISTGEYEALELRDKDGGVKKAIENIEKIIAPVLIKEGLADQKKIDEILLQLDATKNKSRLGANAILAVSIVCCRALAREKKLSLYQYISQLANVKIALPKPSFNMIEGGRHVQESGLIFQELMIVPQKNSFKENLIIGQKIYKTLKTILKKKFGSKILKLSSEGAFSSPVGKVSAALDLILEAAGKLGVQKDIKIAVDAAASEFFKNNNYQIGKNAVSKERLLEFYKNLVNKYPILSIEDPFFENDWDGFVKITNNLGSKIIIFGDDLTVSDSERIKLAKERRAGNGLILKPNQIGTVTETIVAANLAKSFGWKIMVSNRAGETNDDFIADLAVGVGADYIKSGAPFSKERAVKYKRLAKIEKEMV